MNGLGARIEAAWRTACLIAVDGPGGVGQGHHRQAARRPFQAAPSRYRLLYRAVGWRQPGAWPAAPVAAASPAAGRPRRPRAARRRGRTGASKVRRNPAGVRANLLKFQREFASQAPGAVLDGRDIGTVICPDAPVKLFVTARRSAAERRFRELRARGGHYKAARSCRDGGAGPSRQRTGGCTFEAAPDAFLLDTSGHGCRRGLRRRVGIHREQGLSSRRAVSRRRRIEDYQRRLRHGRVRTRCFKAVDPPDLTGWPTGGSVSPGIDEGRGIEWLRAAPCVRSRTTPPARSSLRSSTNRSAVRRASKARSSRARVVRIANDFVVVDVGLKSEGRIAAPRIRQRRPAAGGQGRRHRRRLRRPHGEQGRRSRPVARQGASRGSLDRPREGLHRPGARHGHDLRPRQGRLHGRPVGRRGLPAGQPGRCPPGARRRPADGPGPAVRHPQDGPPPRQHRRVAPRRAWKRPAPRTAPA